MCTDVKKPPIGGCPPPVFPALTPGRCCLSDGASIDVTSTIRNAFDTRATRCSRAVDEVAVTVHGGGAKIRTETDVLRAVLWHLVQSRRFSIGLARRSTRGLLQCARPMPWRPT